MVWHAKSGLAKTVPGADLHSGAKNRTCAKMKTMKRINKQTNIIVKLENDCEASRRQKYSATRQEDREVAAGPSIATEKRRRKPTAQKRNGHHRANARRCRLENFRYSSEPTTQVLAGRLFPCRAWIIAVLQVESQQESGQFLTGSSRSLSRLASSAVSSASAIDRRG
jgi:hypothetical protein